MSYESYMIVCYFCAAVSFALLAVSIILFFKLGIKGVIGDLTGVTAKKAIEDIRERNVLSGNKAYKPSPINMERGKVTDRMSPSGGVTDETDEILKVSVGTEKISKLQGNETTVLSAETTVLKTAPSENAGGFEIEENIVFTHTDEKIN